MSFEVKVIEDSVSPQGKRLTTIFAKYPKWIHGEAKTHRKMRVGSVAYDFLEEVGFMDDPSLSRNASSSRAIPVKRMIDDILSDPVEPIFWGKNQPGMAADEELDDIIKKQVVKLWKEAKESAIVHAMHMDYYGAHKQIINRILEPFMHIRVVVTATDWQNFFHLRCHPAAQPEMCYLATLMRDAMAKSVPRQLNLGEWHLPYVNADELHEFDINTCRKLSVARCARVSYLTHEGKRPLPHEDIALYDRLVDGDVVHASPTEHQATPDCMVQGRWVTERLHGNLTGWQQYRKMLTGESVEG